MDVGNWQRLVLSLFQAALRLAFNLTILALLLGLGVGLIRTFLELGLTLSEPSVRLGLKDLLVNALSLVVILELVRAFVEYFEFERVRLEVLLEVGVAFLLREMLLGLFAGEIRGLDILFWSLALLALVGGRVLAVLYPPGGQRSPDPQPAPPREG